MAEKAFKAVKDAISKLGLKAPYKVLKTYSTESSILQAHQISSPNEVTEAYGEDKRVSTIVISITVELQLLSICR